MAKRRNVMLGLGALATGSGAAFTSGAFSDAAVDSTADFRVVVADELVARGLDPDSSEEYDNRAPGTDVALAPDEDPGVPTGEDGHIDFAALDIDDVNELPVATVDEFDDESPDTNVNEDLTIHFASNFSNGDTDNLFAIENRGTTTRDVAIAFRDIDGTDDAENAYGEDVDTTDYSDGDDGDISRTQVQEIYQFEADVVASDGTVEESEVLISPDPEEGDDGSEDYDDPANFVSLDTGEIAYVDLNVDFTGNQADIRDAANADGNPFDGDTGEVDLLDTLYVGAGNPE